MKRAGLKGRPRPCDSTLDATDQTCLVRSLGGPSSALIQYSVHPHHHRSRCPFHSPSPHLSTSVHRQQISSRGRRSHHGGGVDCRLHPFQWQMTRAEPCPFRARTQSSCVQVHRSLSTYPSSLHRCPSTARPCRPHCLG